MIFSEAEALYPTESPLSSGSSSGVVRWDYNWDSRQGERSRASRHLILIRHGQYNMSGTTDQERSLTSLGRTQADRTGARLAELSLPYTHLVHSDMTRAVETAGLISQHLPKVQVLPTDGILREGAPIKPEPKVDSWKPETFYMTDGARIEAAFRKYFHRAPPSQEKDSYEIIVCHANVIRCFSQKTRHQSHHH